MPRDLPLPWCCKMDVEIHKAKCWWVVHIWTLPNGFGNLTSRHVLLAIPICMFLNFTFCVSHCYEHLQYVLCCLWQSNAHCTWVTARRLAQSTVTAKEERLSRFYYYPEVCLLPSIVSLPTAPTLTLPLLTPQKCSAQHIQNIFHFLYYRIIFYCIIMFYYSFSPIYISSLGANNYLNLQNSLHSSRVCNRA